MNIQKGAMRFGYVGNKHAERREITDSPTERRGDYPIRDYRVSEEEDIVVLASS